MASGRAWHSSSKTRPARSSSVSPGNTGQVRCTRIGPWSNWSSTKWTVHPDTRIEVEQVFYVPGLVPEEDGAAESLVRGLTGDNGSHVVSYGTEAGQYQEAGYSAVICGPGDIAQAHQADEFITVAQFEAGHQFMRDLVARLRQ